MKTLNKITIIVCIIQLLLNNLYAQTIDWSKKGNPDNLQVNGVAFNAGGQKVLSGTNCHPASIRMFDVASSNLEWDYVVGNTYMCIMGVTFSSNTNYIAAIEEFGNIFIFDNTGAIPVITDTINTGTAYAFATTISPDNTKVAVGCSNGKLKIYNLPGGTLAYDINAHPNWVMSVAYSPNGNYIATGGSDNKVKIWTSSGMLLHTCNGHTGHVTSVKISPDNQYVISGSKDDKIRIWKIADGSLVTTLSGHTADVNAIDVSPDGTKIVSASSDNYCKIWDINSASAISTFGVPDSGKVYAVAWSPAGNKIVTGNERSDVTLWNIPVNLSNAEYINNSTVSIYPNPVNSYLHIHSTDIIESVIVFDLLGKQENLTHKHTTHLNINMSNLPSGIYYIQITTSNNSIFTQKIIKN